MKTHFCSTLSFLIAATVFGQAPHTVGTIPGGNSIFYSTASLLNDGGTLTCANDVGAITLVRTNVEGVVQWTRKVQFDPMMYNLDPLACGEWVNGDLFVFGTYAGTGTFNAYFVFRLDPQGGVIWGRHYDLDSFAGGEYYTSSAVARANGHLMLNIAQFTTMMLAEIDASGDVLSIKSYAFDDEKCPGLGCIPTFDDGTVLCGKDSSDQCLVRLSATGDVIWAHTYENNDYTHARDLLQTADGGFLVCGSHSAMYGGFGEMAFAMKLDANGDVIWHRTYTASFDMAGLYRFEKVVQLPDGGFAFFSEDYTHQMLVVTDGDGTPISSRATSIPGSEMNMSHEELLGVHSGLLRLAGYMTIVEDAVGTNYFLDRALAIDGTADCMAVEVNVTMETTAAPTTPDPDLFIGTPTITVGPMDITSVDGTCAATDICELFTGMAVPVVPSTNLELLPNVVLSGDPIRLELEPTDAAAITVLDAAGRIVNVHIEPATPSTRIPTLGLAPGRYMLRVDLRVGAPVFRPFVVE